MDAACSHPSLSMIAIRLCSHNNLSVFATLQSYRLIFAALQRVGNFFVGDIGACSNADSCSYRHIHNVSDIVIFIAVYRVTGQDDRDGTDMSQIYY
mgnify:CR=1 FL=1